MTADKMARAFNFPYIIVQGAGGLGGMTSSAAIFEAGIPAVIAEIGGCGLLESDAVEAHLAGVHNALRAVGMLPGAVTPSPVAQHLSRDFRWMRCQDAGWWQSEVAVGEMVQSGQRLGAIQDPYGDEIEEIIAPLPGAIGFRHHQSGGHRRRPAAGDRRRALAALAGPASERLLP